MSWWVFWADRTLQPANLARQELRLMSTQYNRRPALKDLSPQQMDCFQFILLNGRLLNLQQKYALMLKDEQAPFVSMELINMKNESQQQWIVEFEY